MLIGVDVGMLIGNGWVVFLSRVFIVVGVSGLWLLVIKVFCISVVMVVMCGEDIEVLFLLL